MEIIGGVGIEIVGDYSGLQEDLDAAQALAASAAAKIADALEVSAPDTAPVTAALQQVSDAATATGQSIASALDVQITPPDVSAVVDSFAALSDSATASAGAIAGAFSGEALPAPDTSAIVDGFSAIDSAAQQAASTIAEDFASFTIPAPDLSGFTSQLSLADEDLGKLESDFLSLEGSASAAAGSFGEVATAIGQESTAALDGQAALQAIIQQLQDGEISGKEFVSMSNALANAMEAVGAEAPALAGGIEQVAAAEQSAGDQAATLSKAVTDTGTAADEASNGLKEMAAALVAIGTALAITSGLETLAKDALEAADNIARTTISLTALTGSADGAAAEIQNLESLANSDALSFPKLQQAAVSMTALLGPSTDVEKNLKAIADGAAVMGTSIDAAAKKFDTLAESGTASARALATMGLNLGDLAKAMNALGLAQDATAESAAKLFKALDISDRVDVLDTALGKFAGDAEKLAGTLSGQWVTLGNQIDQALRQIGDALTPLATQLLSFANNSVIPFLDDLIKDFQALPEPVQNTAIAMGVLVGSLAPIAAGLGAIGLAVAAAQTAIPALTGLIETLGISSAATAAEEELAAVATTHLGEAAEVAAGESGLGGLASGATLAEGAVSGLAGVIGLGLVVAVTAAVAGFSDLKAGMASVEAQAAATDAAFQKWIQSETDAAIKSGDVAKAQDDIKTALDAGAISTQKATQLLGELADAQKKVVGVDWKGYASDLGIVVTNLDLTSAATQKLYDAVGKQNDALDSAKAVLADVAKDYAAGEASATDLAKAQQAVDAATTALYGKQQTLKDTTVPLAQATHELADYTEDALDPTNNLAASEAALFANIDKTQESVLHANANLQAAVDRLNDVKAAAENGTAGLGDVEQAENNVATAAAKLEAAQKAANAALLAIENANVKTALAAVNEALSQTGGDAIIAADNLKDLENEFPVLAGAVGSAAPAMAGVNKALIDFGANAQNAGKPIPDLKAGIDGLIGEIPQLTQAFQNGQISQDQYDKGLALLGTDIGKMAKDDLPGAIKAWGDLVSAQVAAHASIGVIQGDLSSWEGAIQKLATTDLPAAIAAQQQYLDQLAKIPGSYQQIVQGQENMLQEEIKWAQMSGADASAYEIQLDILKDKISGAGNDSLYQAFKDLRQINSDMFKDFESNMADAIVSTHNFGDAFIKTGQAIAKELIDDVLKSALQPVQKAIDGLIKSLFSDLPTAGGVSKQAIDSLSKSAQDASDAFPAVTKSADTMASSMGSFASSLSSWIGAIGAVIGAIAGIVGDVYLAAIDTKLFTVETDLNEIFQETTNRRKDAWDQHNQMYDRIGEIENVLEAIRDGLSTISITAGGGLTPDQAAALEASGDAAPVMVADLNVIAANTAYTFAKLVDIWGELDVAFGGNSIYDMLAEINSSVLAVVTAIDYGTQSGKSYSDQSAEASQALAQDVTNSGMSAHADLSKVDTSIQQGTASGRANTQLTVDQQIAKRQDDIAAAQAASDAALNIADQIAALRNEYDADIAAMNDALRAGNIDLAAQYQQAAKNVQAQITPLLSSTATNTANTAAYVQDAGNQVGIAATNAGVLVSTAVNQSAATISQAVINSAAASASLFNTGLSSLISTMGAFGKTGGGLPGGQTGLPSGSGGGNTNPNGTPTYTIPGVSNPGVTGGNQQPGFNPNQPLTGGMTQAQWIATGHNSQAPDWWLNGTPQPGINQSNLPHFLTGGGVDVGGLAIVDSGEVVIPSDIAAAVKSGEAVVSSPHLTSDGGSSTIFTQPNPVDLSSQDKGFVDNGQSTDPNAWKALADQVKGVGDAIAAQDKARAAVADQMATYQAEMAHAQQLLTDATQSGNKDQIALAQQYVAMMGRLIDSTVANKPPSVSVTAVGATSGIEITSVSASAAAALTGPANKTPIVDPSTQPATSDQAKQVAVLQQAANDAQAALIAANKSGDATKIQLAQQQVSLATNALSAAQAQQQASQQLVTIQQAILLDQQNMVSAQLSGDATKIAIAQQVLATDNALLVSAMAQQQTVATAIAKPAVEITQVGDRLSLQLGAINQQLITAESNLSAAFQSGDQQAITLAQQQVDTLRQLLVATMAQQSGGVAPSGPSQQDLLTASMNWLSAQQGLSAGDIASATSTYQNDAKAGLLPSPNGGSSFSGYNPYSTPSAAQQLAPTSIGPPNKTPIVDAAPAGPANKTPIMDVPSFDVGGLVSADMLAMVHAGEWVIPANGKVLLPPEVMARIQMPTIPGAPNVPDVPLSTSGGGSNDSYSFNIYGITDPDLLMREISSRVKTRTGRTAKFSN